MLNEIFQYIGFADFVEDANDVLTEKPEVIKKTGVFVPTMTE